MKALFQLCRLYYAVPFALTYALTVCYAAGGRMEGRWPDLALSTAALALLIAGGYVLNDVFDLPVDRVAAPGRPLVSGRIDPRTAALWGAGLMASGLAAAAACRWQFLLTLSAVAAGILFYDARSKRLGTGKQLLVAALLTSIYPLALAQAGGASGPRALSLALFPAWLFLTGFGYEVLKDIRDIEGDRLAAAGPGPIQRDPRRWRRIADVAILAAAALLVGPRFAGCGWVYLSIACLAMAAALVSVFLPLRAAMAAVYAECVLVGIAATADVVALGP